jgi:UDP-glucuronate decarboxylase
MKILVTGGAGFLGYHLVRKLLDQKNEVVIVDNLATGSAYNLPRNSSATFIQDDICTLDYETLHKKKTSKPFDRIYNLACPASPIAYQATPIQTWLSSTLGVYRVCRFAIDQKARLLHTSTSEVYGNPSVHPQPESYLGYVNSYGPRACYDEGKRAAEALIYDFQRVAELDARIVRIFNTYGPRMDMNDGRVVSNFICQALKNKPITIYGDGEQTRSFCYVDDTVDGMVKVMEGKYPKPLNLGNPDEFTMNQLAEEIIQLTGSKSKIQQHELPVDDPQQRRPDIKLIKQMTGWVPMVTTTVGLQKTIDYFRDSITETLT